MNMEMKKSFRINIRPLYKAITSGFESEPTKKEGMKFYNEHIFGIENT